MEGFVPIGKYGINIKYIKWTSLAKRGDLKIRVFGGRSDDDSEFKIHPDDPFYDYLIGLFYPIQISGFISYDKYNINIKYIKWTSFNKEKELKIRVFGGKTDDDKEFKIRQDDEDYDRLVKAFGY